MIMFIQYSEGREMPHAEKTKKKHTKKTKLSIKIFHRRHVTLIFYYIALLLTLNYKPPCNSPLKGVIAWCGDGIG